MDQRQKLEESVEAILASESDGSLLLTREHQAIDFKEEAGRRIGKIIEPGSPQNPEAAKKLADEVACFANTPGGGALILGVEDRTGALIGTELDVDWLRQRIHRAVDIAPDIRERRVGGQRLLVLFVAESPEPVTDSGDRIRWRVGDSCVAVDRAEWWEHRSTRLGYDPMGAASDRGLTDVTPRALALVREYVPGGDDLSAEQLIRRIGGLRSDGRLSAAAALLLTPVGWSAIDLTTLEVPGGALLGREAARQDQSLIEQLEYIETALNARNLPISRTDRFAATPIREVPQQAAREAILNGLVHRDWNRREPTEVRWISADSTLLVRSPGGFSGEVSERNVLSSRHARYPALADLFRALGLVEKQGLGVDRMYQAMIVVGHRPPRIVEVSGPHVECVLVGGEPVNPVVELVRAIRPVARQDDFRIAIIVFVLLREPYLTIDTLAEVLQAHAEEARDAVRSAMQTTVDDEPLIVEYKDVWMFGPGAWARAVAAGSGTRLDPAMAHASTAPDTLRAVVEHWLSTHEAVTSGDLMEVTGVSRGTAQRFLREQGWLSSEGAGRTTRFVRRK
ncbi:DUF5635 domain-containing protein [Tsukamurella spumae]|nr:DUF5635 domain-containing protein [Tsukamurella spumae]